MRRISTEIYDIFKRNEETNIVISQCRKVCIYVFWFSSAINILALFLPLYTAQVLDRVMSSGSESTLLMLTIITMIAFLCSSSLDACRSIVMIRIGDLIDNRLSSFFIKKSISIASIRGSSTTGESIRDLNVVKNFITSNGLLTLFDMPWSIVYLISIFIINTVSGVITLTGVFILLGFAFLNEFIVKKSVKTANEENIKNIQSVDIASRNSEIVESMGMIDRILKIWEIKNKKSRDMQKSSNEKAAFLSAIVKFIRMTLQISIIGSGAYFAISGQGSAGGIIASSILMGRTLAPFEALIGILKGFTHVKMSYHRLAMLIESSHHRQEMSKLPEPQGLLSIEKVIFSHFNSKLPVIKDISLKIDIGEIVGIIGSSASGKSTLAKLLVGIWKPNIGTIRLDGADVYLYNRKDFGKYVGYLPQDIELFNASIRDNIAKMDNMADIENIIKAAKIVGIHEEILKFPNGYDTIIGKENGGLILSGGQKQKIALARAFYGNVKLVILDEPNSNLDNIGDRCLYRALEYAAINKITVVFITHKLDILKTANRIITIDGGKIVRIQQREISN